MGKQASVKSGPPEMQDDADNSAHPRVRCLPASSTVSRGCHPGTRRRKGHDCRHTVKRAHVRPDGSAPAPMMRIGLLCRSSNLPAVIKQARTHTRSAAAVANAQVHQPQGAPGTHVTLGGSTPAPIPLIWLSPRLRVLPAHIHTRSAAAVDNAQVPGTLVTPGGSSPVLMHALSAPASTR